MTDRSAVHDTFAIERVFAAPPAQVFKFFSDRALKARWFPPGAEFDFRIGGVEANRGGPPGGPAFTFDSRYLDIVANRRIVFCYDMTMDGVRISASLATVEFEPAEAGTRFTYTEQGVFLDKLDQPAWREQGTRAHIDALAAALEGYKTAAA